MNITLRPKTQKRINEKVDSREFDSADALVEYALTFLLDYEDEEMDAAEFREPRAAVERAWNRRIVVKGSRYRS